MLAVLKVLGLLLLSQQAESACPRPHRLQNGHPTPMKDEYEPLERVTYTCEPRHYAQTREGVANHTFEFQCQYVMRWSAVTEEGPQRAHRDQSLTFAFLPECIPFQQCDRPNLDDSVYIEGDTGKNEYDAEEEIQFGCNDTAAVVDGQSEATCLISGIWSSPPPRCVVPKRCFVNRPSPNMRHEPVAESLEPGQYIIYRCNHGYTMMLGGKSLVGEGEGHEEDDFRSHTRTCRLDGRLDGPEPYCKSFTCKRGSRSLEHGHATFTGNRTESLPGELVYYRCKHGYRMIGDNVQYCHLYRGWVGEKPFCGLKYCITPKVRNGLPVPNSNTFLAGESVRFECYDGHVRLGPSELTCGDNFDWNTDAITVCQPAKDYGPCMDLGIPHNAARHFTYYTNTTIVTYFCEDSFKLDGSKVLHCRDDVGKWNGTAPLCKSQYSFPDPQKEALRLLTRVKESIMADEPSNGGDIYGPATVYLAVDLSGSQANHTVTSAVNFLNPVILELMSLHPEIKIGLIGFSQEAYVLLEPSDYPYNVTTLLKSFKSIQGGTNIAAALRLSLEAQEKEETGKKIVVMATDGLYNAGGNPKEAAEALHKADIDLVVVSLSLSTLGKHIEELVSNSAADLFHVHENSIINDDFQLPEETYNECGRSTAENPRPWIVNLEYRDQRIVGVLVGARWVLALYRMGNRTQPSDITVKYGKAFQHTAAVKQYEVQKKKFALLYLEEAVVLAPDVRTLCLPVPIEDQSHAGFAVYTRNMLYDVGTNERVFGLRSVFRAAIKKCPEKKDNKLFCVEKRTKKKTYDLELEDRSHEIEAEIKEENEAEEILPTTVSTTTTTTSTTTTTTTPTTEIPYYDRSDYNYYDYDDYEIFEHIETPRDRRSLSEDDIEDGSVVVGRVMNRWDFRDMRSVLTGFYNGRSGVFEKAAQLSMDVFSYTQQIQGTA